MPAPRYAPPVRSQPHFLGITPSFVSKWTPTLALWGVGLAGAGVVYLASIPRFRDDVLKKVPLLNAYYEDKTPESDKPF